MSDTVGEALEPNVERGREGGPWPSLVWIVPLFVVVAAVVLLTQSLANRGPLITIAFETATGITAGETAVRYRDVTVGKVEKVRFSEGLDRVLADVRMSLEVEPYLDDSARFWLVRPEVSAQRITGLETVLGGTYIEGSWDTTVGKPVRDFMAAAQPPLTPEGAAGLRVRLRATEGGSIDVGSPVFFKRVEVGRVESKQLTEAGDAVVFDLFVTAPNDERLTTTSRFWNVSGLDVEIGASGARLHVASLASLIRGGVSFDSFGARDGEPIAPGHEYRLYGSPSEAREDVAADDLVGTVTLEIAFDEAVRGLRAGAAVEFEGVAVGQVVAVAARANLETGRFETLTTVAVAPERIGFAEQDADGVIGFFDRAVAEGLRARLALGNFLSGALFVELVDVADAVPAQLIPGEPPRLPSVASDIDEFSGSVAGLIDRVDALPIEALLNNAVTLLANVNLLLEDDNTRALPGDARAVLGAALGVVSSPALERTLADAEALAAALRRVAQDPALAAAPEQLSALLGQASELVGDEALARALADLEAASAALRRTLEDPALARLPARAEIAVEALAALASDPALMAAPGELNATLSALRTAVEAAEVDGIGSELAATLGALRARLEDPALSRALTELPATLETLRTTVAGLGRQANPALAALRRLLEDPGTTALPSEAAATLAAARTLLEDEGLRGATGEAAGALAALRALLEQGATQRAPEELAATLASARGLLASLERAGAAEELATTLASARKLFDDPALQRLSASLTETLAAVRAVLEAPGTAELPEATTEALRTASRVLADIERQNLAAAASGALNGVADAAGSIEGSVAGLPRLVARLAEVSASADEVLASLAVGSELNYEALAALRDIREAARAVSDLAQLIERQPNAFIVGK